jgi:hypothetical protein
VPTLSKNTIRAIFDEIVKLRGSGKSSLTKTIDKFSVNKKNEEIERLKELAGLTEGPINYAKQFVSKKYNNAKRSTGKFRERNEITYEDLYDAWEDLHSPTDLREIVRMLREFDISDGEIKRALKNAGVTGSDDQKITNLANSIIAANMAEPVLQYLDGVTESVELTEAPITNKAIKYLFTRLADLIPAQSNEGLGEGDYPKKGVSDNEI